MRLSVCLIPFLVVTHPGAIAAPQPESHEVVRECMRMTVASTPIASYGGEARQHYRIFFENLCDAVRVVYWCAEHPSKTLTAGSVCPRSSAHSSSPGTALAAPLYAVNRQREFQWTFPHGTLIRYVDCNGATYPTSDFRCAPAGLRPR